MEIARIRTLPSKTRVEHSNMAFRNKKAQICDTQTPNIATGHSMGWEGKDFLGDNLLCENK